MSNSAEKSIEQTDQAMLETETVSTSEEEAEEFAKAIMQRAASLKVVKIQRDVFLRTEIKKRFPEIDADLAVDTTPAEAGISPVDLDRMAIDAIELETTKCAGLSFLAGIPGGLAMVGTVPADLAQYFAHVMRIEQKLAYIYGWQSFLNEDDEVDDETVMKLVVLMGVMMQVGGAANAVTAFASTTARKGIEKAIQKQALTKTIWYNPMKKVLRYLGVNLTKQTFAKTASKVVPVIGGAISGGMTYAAYKPGAERLRRYLRSLPISRIDESMYPDLVAIEADKAAVTRNQAIKDAKAAALNATQTAGELAAGVVGAASTAATEGLQTAGEKVEDALDTASRFIGSIRAQRRLEKKASTQQNEKPSDVFDANLEKVKKLKELLDCGVLTQEEFDSKKKELLGL
ncbi:SHOCT domain-containing protein [uncultured Collinsella sp.]|uniref:SHOCT domain-containing protein n=1 Tax=uncultured Collinsella sp. TaxID=165190 RepID=UPI0025DEAFAE|nr:SHOCT domain-containing protein [uncultured Collinsella sp.]